MLELITKDAEATAPELTQTLDELARQGARRMIAEALQLEVDEHVHRMRHLRDEQAHTLVVRNGKARERTVTLGAGVVKIRAPRVHDRRAEHRFTSRILPPYMRRSPRLEEALARTVSAGALDGRLLGSTAGAVGTRSCRALGDDH